jgi:UDP-perosamine 4-acetyltransferase
MPQRLTRDRARARRLGGGRRWRLAGAADERGGEESECEKTTQRTRDPIRETALSPYLRRRTASNTAVRSATVTDAPTPILGLGAGTHAKSVLEALHSDGRWKPVALVDDDPGRAGAELLGVPIVFGEEAVGRLRASGVCHGFVGVGGIVDPDPRRRVFERLRESALEIPPIVHAAATVSRWARLCAGAQVLAAAVVNADATVGDGAIVNTGAIVEHDCRIGAHAHVAPGARLAGLVEVGTGAHVGIGAVVIEGKRIGAGALVAAGAVVVADVEEGARVAGVPARPLAQVAAPR